MICGTSRESGLACHCRYCRGVYEDIDAGKSEQCTCTIFLPACHGGAIAGEPDDEDDEDDEDD